MASLHAAHTEPACARGAGARFSTRAAPSLRRAAAIVSATALVGALAAAAAVAGTAHAGTLRLDAPDGARLTVDGHAVGVLPLSSPLPLAPGAHALRLDMAGAHAAVADVEVGPQDEIVHLTMRLAPKSRVNATARSVLLAGLGQQYIGRPQLGWALMATEVGAAAVAGFAQLQFQQSEDDFNAARLIYVNALDPERIATARADADKAYDDMGSAESLRNTALVVAGAAVLASALDAWFRFPRLELGPGAGPGAGPAGGRGADGAAGPPVGARSHAAASPAWSSAGFHLSLQATF